MRLFLSKLSSIFEGFSQTPASVIMLGLDAAGKTTVLYKLKLDECVTTIPTVGFNVETVTPCKGLNPTVCDVGGQTLIRPLWRHYYNNAQGLIYVVDSNDPSRFNESREELSGIVNYDGMERVPVLVLANKQDLPNAQGVDPITKELGLRDLKNKWHIQACCAVNGDGILEGMEVFCSMVKQFNAGKL